MTLSTRAALERGAELGEAFGIARDDYFDIAIFGVADPAFELEFAGLAVDEPAEAYALNAASNEEVKDHDLSSVTDGDCGLQCSIGLRNALTGSAGQITLYCKVS